MKKDRIQKGVPFNYFYLSFGTFVFLLVLGNPLFAQECDTAKTLKEKKDLATQAETRATKALQDFNNLPTLPPKPTSGKDTSAEKKATDAARDKWLKAKEALTETNKNLKNKDGATLRQEIEDKKRQISEIQKRFEGKDVSSYLKNKDKIVAQENKITSQMNGYNFNTAKGKLNDVSYKNNDPSKVSDNEAVEQAGQALLDNDVFKSDTIKKLQAELQGAMNSTKGVFSSGGKSPWKEVQRIGPLLIREIEAVQTSVKEDFKELENLDRDGIKQFENDIATTRGELETLEDQLKPVTDAEKNVTDTKKEFDEAEKKRNAAEKDSEKADKALKDWETAENKYKNAEKEKNDSASDKANADTEKNNAENAYNKAVNEKNKLLTKAQTAAALDSLDARLAMVNKDLLKKAADEVLENNSKVEENKKKIEQALKTAQNEDQKMLLKKKWKDYFTKIVRPHYIRKRNEAEANRLRGIRDEALLQSVNCFDDVAEFIQKLNLTADEVLKRTASIASDLDDGISEGADEPIPVTIPPLEETAEDENPTDEVPDDIVANTGEIKVVQYFIFLLTNSSNGLYVGGEDSLKGQLRCSFIGGGVGCDASDVISYKKLLGPFASQPEAQQGLCQSITETRYFPLGVGLKGRWQGGNNWYGLWNAGVEGCSK